MNNITNNPAVESACDAQAALAGAYAEYAAAVDGGAPLEKLASFAYSVACAQSLVDGVKVEMGQFTTFQAGYLAGAALHFRAKPLEWRDGTIIFIAKAPFGDYVIDGAAGGVFAVYANSVSNRSGNLVISGVMPLDAAKAHAQAHYNNQVAELLAPHAVHYAPAGTKTTYDEIAAQAAQSGVSHGK